MTKPTAFTVSDNGMSLDLPTENYQIIDQHHLAQKISSLLTQFKLVDFAWANEKALWLIEFKKFYDDQNPHYQEIDLANEKTQKQKVDELADKIICTMLLLNQRHEQLMAIFPQDIKPDLPCFAVQLLRIRPEHRQHLLNVKHQISRRLEDYGIRLDNLLVLDYDEQRQLLEDTLKR